ncbi:hypothetical protein DY000_02021871 [Brassica cretica]|uniref:Uncharacterized protein n=1 Tax=Brassica cretica TaxID=69181 RepID=A0ABQ7ECK5_BRACR|nr:hypothetical protein DY000_02021871 [Brassica cretica]
MLCYRSTVLHLLDSFLLRDRLTTLQSNGYNFCYRLLIDLKSVVEKPRVISDRSVGVLWLLVKGDWKYSENLGSTIEEHRPCHFGSSMIGGTTKVASEHGYTMLEWDLFHMFFESKFVARITRICWLCNLTAHDHSDALILPASQVYPAYAETTRSILLATKYREAYDAKKKKLGPQDTEEGLNRSRELKEGFGSKLFGDERDELLVESQTLLQRGEIGLERFQEFKK